MAALRENALADKIEVYIDGGIRRGTDVFKALALGATAVGVGRPALYAMTGYGEDGIVKMLDVLKDELHVSGLAVCDVVWWCGGVCGGGIWWWYIWWHMIVWDGLTRSLGCRCVQPVVVVYGGGIYGGI